MMETASYQVHRLEGTGDQVERIVPLLQLTLPEPPRLGEVRAALVKVGLLNDGDGSTIEGKDGLYFLSTKTKRYQIWKTRA